jgi:hypothetical protein
MVDDEEKAHETGSESKKETRDSDEDIKANAAKFSKVMLGSDTSNVLSLFFSLCLVVAAFLTFLAICVQAFIYNSQLREMKKSTDAATKAAKAAEEGVAFARESAHLDQRAWVAVIDIKGVPEVGKIFTVNITTKNSGKTFAKNFMMRVVIEPITEAGKEPNFSLEESAIAQKEPSVSVLAPNGEYTTNSELRKDRPPHETIQSDLDKIRSDELRIFIHGKLTYDDIFGCGHWSTFCLRLKSDLRYTNYGKHNDADDNRCP